MNRTCECGNTFNSQGICEVCGIIDDNYSEFDFGAHYPFDKENKSYSYGGARGHEVSDISVMTKVNKEECYNSDLKRALKWDGNYNWSVQKTEIINAEFKKIFSTLELDKSFYFLNINRCFLFFRKMKSETGLFGKKLENVALAIVYLLIRIDALPYTLFDLRKKGYAEIGKVYKIYVFLIKKLNLYNKIKRQDPDLFVMKVINFLIPDDPDIYEYKRELALDVIEQFNGIYSKRVLHPAVDITLHSGAGLNTIGALIYKKARELPEIKITQKTISDLCGCSEVTLREHCKAIENYLKRYENLKNG